MLSRRVEKNKKYLKIILIWIFIFFIIWFLTWQSDNNEIPPRKDFVKSDPQTTYPNIVEGEIWQPKISEINILDHIDKILDYDENHEVFNFIEDLEMREKVLRFRRLMKERHLIESQGMTGGEDMEKEILSLLREFKGPNYV